MTKMNLSTGQYSDIESLFEPFALSSGFQNGQPARRDEERISASRRPECWTSSKAYCAIGTIHLLTAQLPA